MYTDFHSVVTISASCHLLKNTRSLMAVQCSAWLSPVWFNTTMMYLTASFPLVFSDSIIRISQTQDLWDWKYSFYAILPLSWNWCRSGLAQEQLAVVIQPPSIHSFFFFEKQLILKNKTHNICSVLHHLVPSVKILQMGLIIWVTFRFL